MKEKHKRSLQNGLGGRRGGSNCQTCNITNVTGDGRTSASCLSKTGTHPQTLLRPLTPGDGHAHLLSVQYDWADSPKLVCLRLDKPKLWMGARLCPDRTTQFNPIIVQLFLNMDTYRHIMSLLWLFRREISHSWYIILLSCSWSVRKTIWLCLVIHNHGYHTKLSIRAMHNQRF